MENKDTVLTSIKSANEDRPPLEIFTEDAKAAEAEDEERYTLSEWGCLYATLLDYNIDLSNVSGRVGKHIVEDFMETMCKCGYITKADE